MFGLGGILAEAFRDTAFAMAPLSKADALGLVSRIRGQALLDGFRGMPAVDRDALADILVALGDLGLAHPRIREIDVNPLLVGPDGMAAVDATIVLGD
jgi:acyl-CoA synthetase (NDP forming)